MFDISEPPTYYFAYGMLTDPELMKGAELVGVGELRHHTFEFAGFANVAPSIGNKVLGALWIIDRTMLGELDDVEGYPHFYDRKTLPVYVDGAKYAAHVYIMRPDSREMLDNAKVKQNYITRIVNGYAHAGIPLNQVRNAL
jgi:gamma-glutamylcyclotransferase (GGCT)/AIG2-like uncharacterized protein YtfP